jgi:hypothetical protein
MTQTSEQATREQYARAEAERQARQQRHTRANGPAASPNTNKLPATPTNNRAVALPDTRTPVARYLDDIAPSGIVGQMIKFKDKRFIITETEEAISEDAEFIAILDQTLIGYVKFLEDSAPVRVQGLLYDGFVMPERCDLGDNDESQWPTGIDGSTLVDPWQHQICMVLQKRETSEFYTFVTSSVTGRRACGQLLRHYDRMRRTNSDEWPLVKLKTGGFAHRDERIGWVSTPAFAVVGRIKKDAAAMPDMAPTDLDDGVPWLP